MRKQNLTMAILGSSACMMVLLLSACSSFQNSKSISASAIEQNTTVFRGKIPAWHKGEKPSYALAQAFQAKHKHRLAIEAFKAVVQNDPGNAAAYNGLGVSLDAMEDFDQAVNAYSAALSIDPNLDYVLNNLGYSYLLQGRPDLAIMYFKKAVALDGTNQLYGNNMGLAYAKSGEYEKALRTFKSVGDDASAHLKMGRFHYRNGYYEEAEVHFAWASILKPSDPEIRRASKANASLAQIHESDQSQAEGKKAFSSQVAKTPLFGHDNNGFFTIPPGAIEKVEIIEIDTSISANDTLFTSTEEPDQPIYRATAVNEMKQNSEQVSADINSKKLHQSQAIKQVGNSSLEVMHSAKIVHTSPKIELSNGNGVNKMARTVGSFLRAKGITGYRLTNADHFDYKQTVIYYRDGFFEQASSVKRLLPGLSGTDHLVAASLDREPIRVLIGRDLIVPFNNYLNYNFNVDVSNGNGVRGMAKRVSKHLIGKGFKVGHLTNATHFGYKRTLVFHNQSQSAHAKLVVDALPGNCESRIIELNNAGNRVQVILGSDMIF